MKQPNDSSVELFNYQIHLILRKPDQWSSREEFELISQSTNSLTN